MSEHPKGHPGGHPGTHPGAEHAPKKFLDDGVTPICRLIAWEVTRSCNLACKHCRAEAHPEPYENELSTQEAKALIDTFPDVGSPIIIFTGGEPMMRHDVYELITYAKTKGLRCVMAPNGTLITPETAQMMKDAGVERCSISSRSNSFAPTTTILVIPIFLAARATEPILPAYFGLNKTI